MPHIGPMELILILMLVLIVFGVGRLPQVGGALGKAIREFKKGQSGEGEAPAKPSPDNSLEASAEKKQA